MCSLAAWILSFVKGLLKSFARVHHWIFYISLNDLGVFFYMVYTSALCWLHVYLIYYHAFLKITKFIIFSFQLSFLWHKKIFCMQAYDAILLSHILR